MATPPAGDVWQRACSFAARKHKDQLRKDEQTPYAAHPCRVAMIVAVLFGCTDEEALAAAMLHDTIEDTTTDFDEIEEEFGSLVARLVAALTKNGALPHAQREREYDAGLAGADWRARLIKLADQYDNLCDLQAIGAGKNEDSRAKAVAKARRAISLAKVDAGAHSETRTAITLVGAAIRAVERRRVGA